MTVGEVIDPRGRSARHHVVIRVVDDVVAVAVQRRDHIHGAAGRIHQRPVHRMSGRVVIENGPAIRDGAVDHDIPAQNMGGTKKDLGGSDGNRRRPDGGVDSGDAAGALERAGDIERGIRRSLTRQIARVREVTTYQSAADQGRFGTLTVSVVTDNDSTIIRRRAAEGCVAEVVDPVHDVARDGRIAVVDNIPRGGAIRKHHRSVRTNIDPAVDRTIDGRSAVRDRQRADPAASTDHHVARRGRVPNIAGDPPVNRRRAVVSGDIALDPAVFCDGDGACVALVGNVADNAPVGPDCDIALAAADDVTRQNPARVDGNRSRILVVYRTVERAAAGDIQRTIAVVGQPSVLRNRDRAAVRRVYNPAVAVDRRGSQRRIGIRTDHAGLAVGDCAGRQGIAAPARAAIGVQGSVVCHSAVQNPLARDGSALADIGIPGMRARAAQHETAVDVQLPRRRSGCRKARQTANIEVRHAVGVEARACLRSGLAAIIDLSRPLHDDVAAKGHSEVQCPRSIATRAGENQAQFRTTGARHPCTAKDGVPVSVAHKRVAAGIDAQLPRDDFTRKGESNVAG